MLAALAVGVFAAGCGSGESGTATDADAVESAGDEAAIAYHRPVFSPDGKRIVFMRQDPSTGGDWELFQAGTDGSNVTRLTTHPGWDGYAAVSPDGEWLTFDRDEGQDTPKGSVLMHLTTGETHPLGKFEGWLTVNAWAPDGERLYTFWEKGGQRDIYAVNAAGEVLEQITDTPAVSEHDIQVTRDGKTLFFATENVDGSGSSIDRLDLASGQRTTLVESTGRAYGISISPDGKTLAYNDDAPGGDDDDAEIFLLDLATGERRQMTDNGDWDHLPVYSPDGGYLLFTSYRTGQERVYRMELDGSVSPLTFSD